MKLSRFFFKTNGSVEYSTSSSVTILDEHIWQVPHGRGYSNRNLHPPNEIGRTNTNQEATTSNPTLYYRGWVTMGGLPNINLPSSPSSRVPFTTPPHHESLLPNQQSPKHHIQGTMQEIRAIKQEIALWTTQLAKGRQSSTLTQDI